MLYAVNLERVRWRRPHVLVKTFGASNIPPPNPLGGWGRGVWKASSSFLSRALRWTNILAEIILHYGLSDPFSYCLMGISQQSHRPFMCIYTYTHTHTYIYMSLASITKTVRIEKSKHTCEKQRRYFEGKIPQVAVFTLSIVGKMILIDGSLNS